MPTPRKIGIGDIIKCQCEKWAMAYVADTPTMIPINPPIRHRITASIRN